jgi:hypothetical protein
MYIWFYPMRILASADESLFNRVISQVMYSGRARWRCFLGVWCYNCGPGQCKHDVVVGDCFGGIARAAMCLVQSFGEMICQGQLLVFFSASGVDFSGSLSSGRGKSSR